MDIPVFKLYLAKFTMDAVQLPDERKAEIMARRDQVVKDVGMRTLVEGSIWSDERFGGYGVEMFPNWQALREYNRCLDELHWFQYVSAETFVGVQTADMPISFEPTPLDPGVDWLAHVWVTQTHPGLYDITDEIWAEMGKVMEQDNALGARDLLWLNLTPTNEAYHLCGVQLIPGMQAQIDIANNHHKAKWYRYIKAQSYLGTPNGGELLKK